MIINSLGMYVISVVLATLCLLISGIAGNNLNKEGITNKQKNIKSIIMLTSFLLSIIIIFYIANDGWSWTPFYSHYFAF